MRVMGGKEPEWSDVPQLLPVRMLNEFVYCPRLFHLEWVSRQFTDNDYTVDGRWQHRAVDEPSGAAPTPGEADEWRKARAIQLSSTSLGLVGKADVLESRDGKVIPVEVKRGSPAPTPERVWAPERVQVCALGLLLRDNGHHCGHGAVFFVQSRERVDIPFTDELIELTTGSLVKAREAAGNPVAPPPLEDSRRCDGCSLVGICLPDETRLLRHERTRPPRRLIPSDDAAKPMYVTEPGAYVSKSGGRVKVSKKREPLASERLIDISQLCIFGNAQVSTQLVRELMMRDIPVCWFSGGGWFNGITEGLPAKNVELRRRQVLAAEVSSIGIARRMIEGKIRNSRTLLRRNSHDRNDEVIESLRKIALRAGRCEKAASLLGHEGTAARLYFGQFSTMLKSHDSLPGSTFEFSGRNRRPPRDAINCLLSYAYSLLTKDCVATLRSVGFDPYLGFLHRPRFGRPALALDLAEEFRPLIAESVVITAINNGEIRPSQFIDRAGGVAFTPDGRKTMLRCFERRMRSEVTHPMFGYRITYRRTIEVQARILAAVLLGELDSYEPMTTR